MVMQITWKQLSLNHTYVGLFRVLEELEPARAHKSSSFIFELELLDSLKMNFYANFFAYLLDKL